MKAITITEFLTEAEVKRAVELYKQVRTGYARLLCEEVIRPNLARINATLGQENNPLYLAYAVEYVITQVVQR